jgi:hypothetical protein
MDLDNYIATMRQSLTTVASSLSPDDEQTKRAVGMLAATVEPAARLALMNALADLAAEVTAELADKVVDVRLEGRDVRVAVTDTAPREEGPSRPRRPPRPDAPPFEGSGDMSRMTVRLVEDLKERAEQAAAAQGVSLNSYVQDTLAGALRNKARWAGGAYGCGHPGWSAPGSSGFSGGPGGIQGWVRG